MDPWTKQFLHLSITALVCFGIIATQLIITGGNAKVSYLPQLLFLCGAGGAVVGNYQRLALLSQKRDKLKDALANSMVTIQLYISPIIGGVFAIILWSAFFSGLLAGDFFPHIEGTNTTYSNFHDLMANTHPGTFADAMKGVFWSFLAGYSERLVPNILDKLADKAA